MGTTGDVIIFIAIIVGLCVCVPLTISNNNSISEGHWESFQKEIKDSLALYVKQKIWAEYVGRIERVWAPTQEVLDSYWRLSRPPNQQEQWDFDRCTVLQQRIQADIAEQEARLNEISWEDLRVSYDVLQREMDFHCRKILEARGKGYFGNKNGTIGHGLDGLYPSQPVPGDVINVSVGGSKEAAPKTAEGSETGLVVVPPSMPDEDPDSSLGYLMRPQWNKYPSDKPWRNILPADWSVMRDFRTIQPQLSAWNDVAIAASVASVAWSVHRHEERKKEPQYHFDPNDHTGANYERAKTEWEHRGWDK